MLELNTVMLPNTTSYGETALNILRQLNSLDVKVNLFPIDIRGIEVLTQDDYNLVQKCLSNCAEFDPVAPSLRLWHAFDNGLNAGRGQHWGFPIFELDKFSNRELSHLNSLDGLLVTSSWGKRVCRENGLEMPIEVVPLGVDRRIFHENYQKQSFPRKFANSTVFINVGKIELRKHDLILKCFEKAFDSGENVELAMLWKNRLLDQSNKKESENWENYYKSSKLANRITLFDWLPTQAEVAQLLCGADCGLFPSHAEGFNFGLLQSMSVGLSVITTFYSAHTEYCSNYNSMLVDIDELELAFDGIWFDGSSGGKWAKLGDSQEEQIIHHMQDIHQRKQAGDNLFNAAGLETARKFSWENTAKRLVEVLS